MKPITVLAVVCLLLSLLSTAGCSGKTGQIPGPTPSVTEVPAAPAQTSVSETKAPQPSLPHTIEEKPVPENAMLPQTPQTETQDPSATLLSFLQIAIQPVGQTMYVWGGGWNEEDTAAGIEAVTLGVSPRWAEFAAEQTAAYNYRTTRYQIHDGLDCSGYAGWAVYNLLETENNKEGYVVKSTKMAEHFSQLGLGEFIPAGEITSWHAGDIMSMKGHVWICVGMCEDDSVLLLHASPPGVIFCGTLLPDGTESRAVSLARQLMSTHYPDWYEKYPDCTRSHDYLTRSSAMRWSEDIVSDPEDLRSKTADEITALLYP